MHSVPSHRWARTDEVPVGGADDGPGEALCSSWVDTDLEAEVLDPALEPLRLNCWIVSEFEEPSTGVVIEGTVGQQMPGDIQDGVGNCDGCLVGPLRFPTPRLISTRAIRRPDVASCSHP